MTLAGGVVVTGELLSVSAEQVLVAQEPSGELAVVDPASVASVRVLAPAGSPAAPTTAGGTAQPSGNSLSSMPPEPETENRSTGLMVAGIATTISGAAALLVFGVGAAVDATTYSSSCDSYGCYDYGGSWTSYMWPLAVAGGAMLSAGIPMWIIGGADVEVEPTVSLAPIGGRGRGFHGGLRFEF
ncbi:MAG: hypothetical protein H6697_07505 [Myxococcales bacterium]|nr:hypothetical protein [Myxococcales bacterium]